MGAFLLIRQDSQATNVAAALSVFETMGLKSPGEFAIGNWKLWNWRKMRSDEDHFILRDKALLVCAGTPVYRNSSTLAESLGLIMNDLQHGNFSYNNIRGSYSLIYSPDGQTIKILTDQAGIANIYFDIDHSIISSSFLAVIFGLKRKVTLDKLAATEVITCGRQIGPDTLFTEIQRLEISLAGRIGEIEVNRDTRLMDFPDDSHSSFKHAVNEQIEAIDSYFRNIKNFGEHYGVDSGLTAGHDSRMMLIQIRKYFKNFQVHSFWRKTKDLELSIAEKVAEKAGIPLRVVEGQHQLDKTDEQLEDTLKKSLYFYDGHIRMHCFLMEDYHTIEHRTAILGDKKLGINGIGGEQYRNEWHMELPVWRLDYFIRYAMAYHLSGQCFTDKKFEETYFSYLQNKLLHKLGIKAGTKWITKKQVQKYYNEVYVASLMGIRTNAENALGHFLTPFIDRQLTRESYKSLPYHGLSFSFQQAMIRKMDPELASVQSGYGYNFTDGEPIKKKLKYLIKEFTPVKIYQEKLNRKYAAGGNRDFEAYLNKYSIFNESVNYFHRFNLPLNEKIFYFKAGYHAGLSEPRLFLALFIKAAPAAGTMRDFIEKFKMYWVGDPNYWKLTDPIKISNYKCSYYPLSFRDRLYQGHYTHFDQDGLPMFPSKAGKLVHFCTGMCSFAFVHWEEYLDTGKQEHADHVIRVAGYLLGMAEKMENGSLMVLDYDSDDRDNGVPCAMNQGESISVLCRAYCLTNDNGYLDAALKMAIPFGFSYGPEGVRANLTENNAAWYLEGGKKILNGHNYALFGLADLVTVSGEQWVKDHLDTGIKSLTDSIAYFDNGFWSWYWLDKPLYIASAMYHNLHICQLTALSQMSGNTKLEDYAKKFAGYARSSACRAKAGAYMLKAKIKKKLG